MKSRREAGSSSCCLWFNLKPQGPEAHGFHSIFLQLTGTICSSNFGICLRIRDLPQPLPDSQIHSLGFKTNSEMSAQQWHASQFFSFIFATCEETTHGLLEKSENANQKKWKIKNRLLWKVSILHLGKMEIR